MKPFCAWSCWIPGLKWEVAVVVEPGAMCHPSPYSSPHCLKHSENSACSSIPLTACPSSSSSPDPAHIAPAKPLPLDGTHLLFPWIQTRREGQQEVTGWLTPALSSSHTSQLHTRSFCPRASRCPLAGVWPSARDSDVKQDENTKDSWTTKQRGCALGGTIKHHEGSGLIASYWFIIKYILSIKAFSYSPPAASWLM